MATTKELLEKKAELGPQLREIAVRNKDVATDAWPAEDAEKWGRIYPEFTKVEKDLEASYREKEAVERILNATAEQIADERSNPHQHNQNPLPGKEDHRSLPKDPAERYQLQEEQRSLAFGAWCQGQYGIQPSEESRKACAAVGIHPGQPQLIFKLGGTRQFNDLQREFRNNSHRPDRMEKVEGSRALSSFIAGTGGALVPDTFLQRLEMNMLYHSNFLAECEVITTSTGEPITWPSADDTSNTAVQVGENDSIATEANPTFKTFTLNAYDLSSKMVKVPFRLMRDSAFDIPSMLGNMFGERFGRFINTWITSSGTGGSQAKALLRSTTLGVTSAGATAITFDELLGLIHSVDIAYRGGAKFMFHDSILEYLRKQVDADDRPIWQVSYRENEPDRIHGYGYVVNNDMPATSSSAPVSATKHVVFGQLSKYKCRRVAEVRMYRLQELYRANDQDGFVSLMSFDGHLLDTGTAPVKHLLQA